MIARRDPATFTVAEMATLRDAAACIDRNRCGIAIVVDSAGVVLDTITDGDIRRAVLAGQALDTPLSALAPRRERSVYAQPVVARSGETDEELLAHMRSRSVRQLPVVNDAGRVVDLVVLDDLVAGESAPLPLRAVVMAGGFGTRLRPYTETVPKPMLPLGDKPLLEHVIAQLRDAGITRVNVTTHYMPEKIRDHFGDGAAHGVHIEYVDEDRPLGTAGALGLIERDTQPLLVMNGDILTRVDVRAMFCFHREQRAAMTVGVRQYETRVPFGVVEVDGPCITRIIEKPTHTFLVNAGVYLIEPSAHARITRGEAVDMPDVIARLVAAGERVASFPVVEYWLDVGRPDDYARAQADVQEGKWKT
jgi:dTDP-glucose pyrophosphorylase/CBS domain-containing protein